MCLNEQSRRLEVLECVDNTTDNVVVCNHTCVFKREQKQLPMLEQDVKVKTAVKIDKPQKISEINCQV